MAGKIEFFAKPQRRKGKPKKAFLTEAQRTQRNTKIFSVVSVPLCEKFFFPMSLDFLRDAQDFVDCGQAGMDFPPGVFAEIAHAVAAGY